jgi:hypothetical protein
LTGLFRAKDRKYTRFDLHFSHNGSKKPVPTLAGNVIAPDGALINALQPLKGTLSAMERPKVNSSAYSNSAPTATPRAKVLKVTGVLDNRLDK